MTEHDYTADLAFRLYLLWGDAIDPDNGGGGPDNNWFRAEDFRRQMRDMAYEKFESAPFSGGAEGSPRVRFGDALSDWLQAEAQVLEFMSW